MKAEYKITGFKLCTQCKETKSTDQFYARTDNPGCLMSACKSCRVIKQLYLDARSRAKKKNLEFNLTREWVREKTTPMICSTTGMKLTLQCDSTGRRTFNRPSIDRIDNAKGYTQDNCRIVSVIYNYAKNDWTDELVMLMAKSLVERGNN